MGCFEEFGVDFMSDGEFFVEVGMISDGQGVFKLKIGKCFYCDFEEKVVGGVVVGLSVYFGIVDFIWI